MELLDVPYPALGKGMILVRNHYSVISAGTEGKTVKDARLSYLGKARARQEEVKKVVTAAKTHGVKKTYKMVMDKLEAPSPLGYSCAGEVIEVGAGVENIKVGDKVACGGSSANHSEIVAVPKNLIVKLENGVDTKHAAFTTIGSIAMQGVRQADLRLGETAVVIGLGLVGQLTMQLLQASGISPIGVDVDERQVELGKKAGFEQSFLRSNEQLENIIMENSSGMGTDAVIITAGTSSLDPVNFAGQITRKKGKVVIVGAVPTGFDRKNFYRKELDLRMSASYGPGRYDADYEEKGQDYPYAYVRWTENRNMQAFSELLTGNKIRLDELITHEFDFEEATNAYQLIMEKEEHFSGIVLKYPENSSTHEEKGITLNRAKPEAQKLNIGFIGAGSFAKNFLLPWLQDKVNLIGVATSRSNTARYAADKYGFDFCTGNADEIIDNDSINTIFITTRHNLHAEYVIKGLKKGKNVFVEKPLCLTKEELQEITAAEKDSKGQVMVGFNRRFAPLIKNIKSQIKKELPVSINYRINAGAVSADHWTQDPNIGGGRIIGEACHFIDLCSFLAGSPITDIAATSMKSTPQLNDTVNIIMSFENGSTASISYFSNGNKKVPKEQLELFQGGTVFQLQDFKQLNLITERGKKTQKGGKQDKGHEGELKEFTKAIKEGYPLPIGFEEIYQVTAKTFELIKSLKS